MVAGDSSEDEDGWRVHERYCIDHRAAFGMHEIVENIFTRAAEFMHDSGPRMDEDHALNCLCFDGDARGLEPFIVQNNILFERS